MHCLMIMDAIFKPLNIVNQITKTIPCDTNNFNYNCFITISAATAEQGYETRF